MPKPPDKRFSIYDTTLTIWSGVESDVDLFVELGKILMSCGMTWQKHPRISKQYKSLSKYNRYSCGGGLECNSEYYPVGMKFEFFQNVVFENRAGGEYDFRRLSKMPYLIKLRYRRAIGRITAYLLEHGFFDLTEREPISSYDAVTKNRAKWMESHGHGFYDPARRQKYNITDLDGNQINDGDIRFTYDERSGRLWKGRAYYSANNAWMLLCNDKKIIYTFSHHLFSWKPGLPRRNKEPTSRSHRRKLCNAFWSLRKVCVEKQHREESR